MAEVSAPSTMQNDMEPLETTWSFIESNLETILGPIDTKEATKALPSQLYMDIYTVIYNYCVNRSRFSQRQQQQLQQGESGAGGSTVLSGGDLYFKLKDYLKSYLVQLKPLDEDYLTFYCRAWKRYLVGAKTLHYAFDYMNRYWVQKERSDGRRDILNIYNLCLVCWKTYIFDNNSEQLVDELIKAIEYKRDLYAYSHNLQACPADAENRTESLIKTCVESLIKLGIDQHDLKKVNLSCYVSNFEDKFLEYTKEYYRKFSDKVLLQNDLNDDFVTILQDIYDFENASIVKLLDDHTKQPLNKALDEVLVWANKDVMYENLEKLLILDSNDNDDAATQRQVKLIATLYKLMKREASLVPKMASVFEHSVQTVGVANVRRLLKQNNMSITPKQYIKNLIATHAKFLQITEQCFGNDSMFIKALDYASRGFINSNDFATPSKMDAGENSSNINGDEISKTPEMLAKYSDLLLKKSAKNEQLVEDMKVSDIMIIFSFLNEKDEFETQYRRLFAKRLIHGTSISDAKEEEVIKNLQKENSMEYTGKITKMFQDIKLSKSLEIEFENAIQLDSEFSRNKYPKFEPFVLAETMWPYSYNKIDFKLPKELEPTYNGFEKLYSSKHSGRILKWLWPLSRGEMEAAIAKPGKPNFIFTLSLFQMSILLQFNTNLGESQSHQSNENTLQNLCEKTGLSQIDLLGHLIPFIKGKLITLHPGFGSATALHDLTVLRDPNVVLKLSTPYKALKTHINFANGVRPDIASNIMQSNDFNAQSSFKPESATDH
ncbi:hypothetical protein ACO0RG_004282 [Hanseniaspora osmophila]|uniref:Cell division control protein 53 n=1 Tax=Hanseniaspora osmophila TaxID=56408 RepID=A0A1E5RBM8_9ASCO|nr:Cell division control protein 53 [Hanseniaspora osmophila]